MAFLFRALGLLPLPVLYLLADGLYFLAFHLVRWKVPRARDNVAAAFPEKSPAEREAIVRQSYRNLARTLMEGIWGYRASGEALMARVAFANPAIIEEYKARRLSVVLLTAHVCNWEWLLLAAGARFGIPIDAVYKTLPSASLDAYLRAARSRFGGNPIPFENFVFELLRRAGEPRAYGMVADQTPDARMPKYWTTFLNRDTAFFLGPERIARYLEAPVLYVEMTRVRTGYYSARLHVLTEPPYGDEDAGPIIAEGYARALEATIRAHPADWLWPHNKWKYGRPSEDAEPGSRKRKAKSKLQG
jgi:KDO2-lipid IV(A) lauroyltransferase